MSKILHLTLKKKWFDLIAEGKKPAEYRANTKYWRSRLLNINSGDFRIYYEIWFYNGGYFDKDKFSFMRVLHCGTMPAYCCEPKNGEIVEDDDFALVLGDIIEIKNWKNDLLK